MGSPDGIAVQEIIDSVDTAMGELGDLEITIEYLRCAGAKIQDTVNAAQYVEGMLGVIGRELRGVAIRLRDTKLRIEQCR